MLGMQETIITAETRVEGDISGQLLRIFGLVTGSMEAEEVIIERGGQVGGNIRAGGLRVFGRVDGAIFAQRVVIESSGMSLGGISAPSVSLAEGCTIQGRLDSNLPEPAANLGGAPPRC
jgi:cytoskeletal protein CcmA (bactofilin family)